MSEPLSQFETLARWPFIDSLYEELLRRGIAYFFPEGRLEVLGGERSRDRAFLCRSGENRVELWWLGLGYSLVSASHFTEQQMQLLGAIGKVLATRYEALWNTTMAAQSFQLFRGQPEDRFVSAFLDPEPYASIEALSLSSDRIAAAIEVLRVSALTTYENRRITTGALLFGRKDDPCHEPPELPSEALLYDGSLTPAKSFYRLCDGLRTLALVDLSGRLTDLIDVAEWAGPYRGMISPVPVPTRYHAHCRATLCGGHVCLVLTPSGEIKIFAEGTQVFRFSDGRWRLTDTEEKYRLWGEAIGDSQLASRLFQVALDMAEDRRGGLFIILDDAEAARHLVQPQDRLEAGPGGLQEDGGPARQTFHYLVRHKRLLDMAPSLIESLAHIDGAIVLDAHSNILAFGAIVQPLSETPGPLPAEGGRTTAAVLASRFGKALKISEDGIIGFYENGHCVWEI
jgi:hypothetical protein